MRPHGDPLLVIGLASGGDRACEPVERGNRTVMTGSLEAGVAFCRPLSASAPAHVYAGPGVRHFAGSIPYPPRAAVRSAGTPRDQRRVRAARQPRRPVGRGRRHLVRRRSVAAMVHRLSAATSAPCTRTSGAGPGPSWRPRTGSRSTRSEAGGRTTSARTAPTCQSGTHLWCRCAPPRSRSTSTPPSPPSSGFRYRLRSRS